MYKKLKTMAAGAGAAALLAGCAASLNAPVPTEIVSKNAAFDNRVTGLVRTEFRTYARTANGSRFEVTGANCVAESREFIVEFTSPDFVRLPITNTRPSSMVVYCDTTDAVGQATYPPAPFSQDFSQDDDRWRYSNGFVEVRLDPK